MCSAADRGPRAFREAAAGRGSRSRTPRIEENRTDRWRRCSGRGYPGGASRGGPKRTCGRRAFRLPCDEGSHEAPVGAEDKVHASDEHGVPDQRRVDAGGQVADHRAVGKSPDRLDGAALVPEVSPGAGPEEVAVHGDPAAEPSTPERVGERTRLEEEQRG